MRILALGDRNPEHLTHRELDAAFELMPTGGWVATDSDEARALDDVDGVWLLPGSPYRSDDAAYAAIRHCLSSGVPFLGTCGGFQYACVELARALAGVGGAAHAESDPEAAELVVAPLSCTLYGDTRLVSPVPGTRLASICGAAPFEGFYFCGFGLAAQYSSALEAAGVVLAGSAPDGGVVAIELREHPFFLATAFQPQVGASSSRKLHPLITAFLDAAASHASGASLSLPMRPTSPATSPAEKVTTEQPA